MAELSYQDWPGCDAAFAWSFYSQGTREQTAVSSDLFLAEALTFFGDEMMAKSAAGAFDKGRRLAQLAGERRALLILDGLEPLQYAPTSPTPGELKDQGIAALLKAMAANSRSLCIVTTRYSIPDFQAYWQTTAPEMKLLRLSKEAGVTLLRKCDVKGTQAEFEKVVEDVKGHALTRNLLGSYLRDSHAGDIRRRDLIKLEEADSEEQCGHAFHVMDAYVKSFEGSGKTAEDNAKGQRALALLELLGLFDRPATAACLNALWNGEAIAGLTEPLIGISEAQRNMSLKRLEEAKLLTVNRDQGSSDLISLDAHPLIREYFALRVHQQQPEAWRAAHRRIYEHLCATTRDKSEPTLEELQPLYQAVSHGCQAGLQFKAHNEVFFARILKGPEFYTLYKLGAFASDLGAIACFFDTPWSDVNSTLPRGTQASLLTTAAFNLRAVGRLAEALSPTRISLDEAVAMEQWEQASQRAVNLSELELTLGDVTSAEGNAERAASYASRRGGFGYWAIARTTHANTLHQAGRRDEAKACFLETETIQALSYAPYPLLYSLSGFQYCDLQLEDAERAASQTVLECLDLSSPLAAVSSLSNAHTPAEDEQPLARGSGVPTNPAGQKTRDQLPHSEKLRAVYMRAAQTIKIAEREFGPLQTAFDHLTMGRAALYEAILELRKGRLEEDQTSSVESQTLLMSPLTVEAARRELDAAVADFRRAGHNEFIALGLLSRGWLRSFIGILGGSQGAQADLDEALEIAERGPMRLLMADIYLYRARLFHSVKPYPWATDAEGTTRGPKDDLAAARKLIEQCGYWRRKEELEDAEQAAKSW
jgi:hypothetical protein